MTDPVPHDHIKDNLLARINGLRDTLQQIILRTIWMNFPELLPPQVDGIPTSELMEKSVGLIVLQRSLETQRIHLAQYLEAMHLVNVCPEEQVIQMEPDFLGTLHLYADDEHDRREEVEAREEAASVKVSEAERLRLEAEDREVEVCKECNAHYGQSEAHDCDGVEPEDEQA